MTIAVMPKHTFNYDGVEVNIYHANKGEGLPRHEHIYAHATMCHSGSRIVRKENKQVIINKDNKPLNLKKRKKC